MATSTYLNDSIDRFEEAWSEDHPPDLAEFLPAGNDQESRGIAIELMRVDIERRWSMGIPESLEKYIQRYPWIEGSAEAKGALAFEEYRVRRQLGEDVLPEEYSRRWKVDSASWPQPSAAAEETATINRGKASTLDVCNDRADKFVEHATAFPKPGDSFGSFHLIRELGRGKFSRVFLARQGELADRPVVLKISSDEWTESEKLARLQHPYVVPVYSVETRGGLTGICMPFRSTITLWNPLQDGKSAQQGAWDLRDALDAAFQQEHGVAAGLDAVSQSLLTRGSRTESKGDPAKEEGRGEDHPQTGLGTKSISWRESVHPQYGSSGHEVLCATLVQKIADGLTHAHQRGIIHRDLKPANILITPDGDPMILDFNLSDDLVVGGRSTSMVGGTFPYMAPEHLEGILTGRHVDERCDIYGLGVLLFEMLTGKQPFPTREGPVVDVVARMVQDRHALLPLEELRAVATPDMVSIVGKCLAPSLAHRYPTTAQVSEDLVRHLAGRPLLYARNRSWKQRISKWILRNRQRVTLSSVAAAAAIVIAIGALTLSWQKQRADHFAAQADFRTAMGTLEQIRERLAVPKLVDADTQQALHREGEELGIGLLKKYPLASATKTAGNQAELLPPEQQALLRAGLGEAAYLLATNALEQPNTVTNDLVRTYASAGLRISPASTPQDFRRQLRVSLANSGIAPELEGRLVAMEHLRIGEYRAAIEHLEPLTNTYPESAIMWLLLGNAYAGEQDFSLAETAFTHSIARSPHSPLAYIYRGLCRMELAQYRGAEADFSRALSLQANLPSVYVNRALARSALELNEDAVDDLNQALSLGRRDPQVLLLKSDILMSLGKNEDAQRELERGLAAEASSPESFLARAEHWLDQGEVQKAMADYHAMSLRYPDSFDAWQNIAKVAADHLHDYGLALKAADHLVKLDPDQGIAWVGRGIALAHLGRRAEAHTDLQKALSLSQDGTICYVAACAYAVLADGDPSSDDAKSAVNWLRTALSQDHAWATMLPNDPDWDGLRSWDEVQSLINAVMTLEHTSSLDGNRLHKQAAPT